MPFDFTQLEINDVVLVEPRVFGDNRGVFMETYKKSDFFDNGIPYEFVQDNHSISQKNVLRGIHFQYPPKSQGKLVRVLQGAVLDVAVDLRQDSGTFLKWVAVELNSENKKMLFIPPGFGHGFLALSDNSHLAYKCTDEYSPENDGGIKWDDKDINIKWPVDDVLVSEKDIRLPYYSEIAEKIKMGMI